MPPWFCLPIIVEIVCLIIAVHLQGNGTCQGRSDALETENYLHCKGRVDPERKTIRVPNSKEKRIGSLEGRILGNRSGHPPGEIIGNDDIHAKKRKPKAKVEDAVERRRREEEQKRREEENETPSKNSRL